MQTQTIDRNTYNEVVVDYYDQCEVDYEIVWHLKSHMSMHYGYWEQDTRRLREALNLMNLKLAQWAGIQPSDYVLDAGCGVGGSAIYLAKNIGCHVHGITLSNNQVDKANQNAANHQVAEYLSFDQQDYLQTSFPSNSFDVVWAIESVCHAFDKEDFLREAYRVLKPGGRLIVADFYRKEMDATSADFLLVKKWADAWAICDFATLPDFMQSVENVGFRNEEARDISKNVLPTIKRLYHAFFPGIVLTTLLEAFKIRNHLQTANTWSTYWQYKAFKKGLWTYNIVTAKKEA